MQTLSARGLVLQPLLHQWQPSLLPLFHFLRHLCKVARPAKPTLQLLCRLGHSQHLCSHHSRRRSCCRPCIIRAWTRPSPSDTSLPRMLLPWDVCRAWACLEGPSLVVCVVPRRWTAPTSMYRPQRDRRSPSYLAGSSTPSRIGSICIQCVITSHLSMCGIDASC